MSSAHRRQFVIGPEPVRASDGWVGRPLAGGVHLSHCPELPVKAGERTGVKGTVLIGHAVETSPRAGTSGWAGRWALVADGRVETDAGGTLAIFYRTIDGSTWLSSSPTLLAALEPAITARPAAIAHATGMDWHPGPSSGLPGVSRLLPTQAIRFDGSVLPRALPTPRVAAYDELLDELEERIVTAVRGFAQSGRDLVVPLSAGRDSRLLLAAAVNAGVSVSAYTFEHPGMSRADRELPPRLAAEVSVPHRFIAAGPIDKARLDLFDEHTHGLVVDIDRTFFGTGQWSQLDPESLELGGGAFEIGRCYYYPKLPAIPPTNAEDLAAAVIHAMPTSETAAVRAWAEWCVEHADHDVDWRDRFYLDQRLGGWLSGIAQGLDLVGPARVHVASSGAIIAALLGLPESVRRVGAHHEHLVRRIAPALAAVPFNPPDSNRSRVVDRARRELELWRRSPSAKAYVTSRASRYSERLATKRLG